MDSALSLAELGWPIFPAMLEDGKKVPIGDLVEHGFKEATTNPKRIKLWWRVRPDALIGVALPRQTVAVDVDDVSLFAKAGLALPDGPGQQTPRGGYHRFFRTDGRRVKQTVKQIPGTDTRVGGRGYVIAWEPDAFVDVSELPDAPEWLYAPDGEAEDEVETTTRRSRKSVELATIRMGERDNELTRVAGGLRRLGLGPDAIYSAFKTMLASGQIESPREDPVTDKDLRRIAGSIGIRQSDAVDRQRRPAPERHNAEDLRAKELQPLEYPIANILPEGLGVVAGAPKVGKSWLTFQAAIELATGGRLLGEKVDNPRPVLYYGLEDGERRFQKRMEKIIDERDLDLSWLELRYDAPAITEGLEEDISSFLDDNGPGAVVFIDILAKVRPASRPKGGGSAYDEDYAIIGPLQRVSKERPGSAIVVVTHDRKAGSEDFLTTVTGTRGVVGAADWVWVVKRDRLSVDGTIFVTGRDIERDVALSARFEGTWHVSSGGAPASIRTTEARDAWEIIRRIGPATISQVTQARYPVDPDPDWANHYNSTSKIVKTLSNLHVVEEVTAHNWVAHTEAEMLAMVAPGAAAPTVTHSTASTRSSRTPRARPPRVRMVQGVHNVHTNNEPYASKPTSHTPAPARTRARAPRHTRSDA